MKNRKKKNNEINDLVRAYDLFNNLDFLHSVKMSVKTLKKKCQNKERFTLKDKDLIFTYLEKIGVKL